jgi:hypothetical protein
MVGQQPLELFILVRIQASQLIPMNKKHILILGKSPLVLQTASSLLQERGYEVETSDNFDDVAARFDLKQVDLITTGGQVPVEKRAEIREIGRELNSDMLFVQGLAGIPGLIVEQIEGEFNKKYQEDQQVPNYDAATRTIKLLLKKQAAVKVTGWWQTTFVPPNPGSDSQILTDEHMSPGEQSISVPASVPEKASFATVQIDHAIYNFSLTNPGV